MKEYPSNPQVFRFDTETRAAVIDAGLATDTLTGGTTNDYNPTGFSAAAAVLIKVTTATQILTGMVSGAVVGRRMHVMCDAASTFNLVLKNQNTGSSANNRFNLNGDLTLKPGQGMSFIWQAAVSGGNAGWRSVSSAFGLDGVIAKDVTQLDVVNTASKTTVFSFTIPAGTLGTDRTLAVDFVGDFFNNSGSARILTIEVSLGSTVLWSDATTAQTAIAILRHPVALRFLLSAQNSASVQILGGVVAMGTAAAATTGQGDIAALVAAATGFTTAVQGSAAENSANDLTFTIAITHATNSVNLSFRRQFAIAYLVGVGATGATGATGAAGAAGAGTVTVPINAQTGTTYTAVAGDLGKKIKCTNASGITLTVPPSVFSAGDVFYVAQGGAGAVTLAPGAGVTLNKPHTLVTGGQYALLTVHCEGSDVFHVWGEST